MLVRRVRGTIGLALLWAVAWAVVFSPLLLWRWLELRRTSHYRPPLWALGAFMLWPAAWGAVSGVGFAVLVALWGRRAGAFALRWKAMGIAGLLSGLVAPLFLGAVWTVAGVAAEFIMPWVVLTVLSGVVNAALALGSLALMHRTTVRSGE